jgi:hypothetical protein
MTSSKFPFNKEKALNAVLYIAENLKRSDFHKIFKITAVRLRFPKR